MGLTSSTRLSKASRDGVVVEAVEEAWMVLAGRSCWVSNGEALTILTTTSVIRSPYGMGEGGSLQPQGETEVSSTEVEIPDTFLWEEQISRLLMVEEDGGRKGMLL